MQSINNDMTQEEYSEIMAQITDLQLKQMMGEDHQEELKKLYKLVEYEEE